MLLFDGSPVNVHDGREHRFLPRWLYPGDDPRLMRSRNAGRYESLVDCCRQRGARKVFLHRTYALGDIVMLLPLAAALHRVLGLADPVVVGVARRFLKTLAPASRGPRVRLVNALGVIDMGADVHLDLNSVLEKDHRGGRESSIHRMDLYAEVLGLDLGACDA